MGYVFSETCMLVNMALTRSECASWVQAWGSILAIVGAVGIAWWQWNNLRENEVRIKKEAAIVIGTALYSIIQDQIRKLDHIKLNLLNAQSKGAISDGDKIFVKWCVDALPDYDEKYLSDVLPAGIKCSRALAVALGSVRLVSEINTTTHAWEMDFYQSMPHLMDAVESSLGTLHIGRRELGNFLGYSHDEN